MVLTAVASAIEASAAVFVTVAVAVSIFDSVTLASWIAESLLEVGMLMHVLA